jgi:uncharacterized protein YqeY
VSEERISIVVEPGAAALRERVERDYTDAMRRRDQAAVGTLRLIRAAFQDLAVARTDAKRSDFGRPLTEADLVAVLEKEFKKREEMIPVYEKAGRAERAAGERAEAAIIANYLPAKVDRAVIVEVVRRIVAEVGPDFRKVMPAAAKELRGKADGKVIQEIVKEITG